MEVCYSLMGWGKEGNSMEVLHWQKGEDLSADHKNSSILFHPRHTLNAILPKNQIFQKLENFVMKSSKRKRRNDVILQKCIL